MKPSLVLGVWRMVARMNTERQGTEPKDRDGVGLFRA